MVLPLLIPLITSLVGAGASYLGNRSANRQAQDIYNQQQNKQQDFLRQRPGQLLNNQAFARSNLINNSNQWGSNNYSSTPTGESLNGNPLFRTTLNQQLSPQAQGMFNTLGGQFNNVANSFNSDPRYLQRNLARATPRWAENKQNIERNLIARGITPGTPAYDSELRRLNQQQADERLQFEDNAFAQDSQFNNDKITQQQALLQQLNQIQAPNPAGSLNVSENTDSDYLLKNFPSDTTAQLNIARNRGEQFAQPFQLLTQGLSQSFLGNNFLKQLQALGLRNGQ